MANLYDDFINHEMENIIDLKKTDMTIDDLYTQVEDKFNNFIYEMKNKIDLNTLKILLKVQIDSSDYNYTMSIPTQSFNSIALIISLGSFIISLFGTGEIGECIYRGYNVSAITALCLIIILIGCILYVPISSGKTSKKSERSLYKKKILIICLSIIEDYEIKCGMKKDNFVSKNVREFHVVVESK